MSDLALLLLRVIPGCMLFGWHGWDKAAACLNYLFRNRTWIHADTVKQLGFPVPAAFATLSAMAESMFCLLMIIGLLSRWSAAAVAFNMATAVYFHFVRGERPEMALLYLTAAIAVALCGPGRYSLDLRGTKPKKKRV